MQDLKEIFEDFPNSQISTLTQNLLERVIADQDPRWGGGEMSAAAYDTAWVAMVRDPHNPQQLAFPKSFEWLLHHQAANGSWSGPGAYAVLPTLAALLALLKTPHPTQQSRQAAGRAEAYLRAALAQWSVRNHESVGFEVLAPGLLAELENLGVSFDFPDKGALMQLYAEKLLIAGPELIYSNRSNLIHSLEAFGSTLDYKRLKTQQALNGSYGCSPAATAAVLIYSPEWDTEAADWLTYLTERTFDGMAGAMPNAYSIDAFESSWVLYNLTQGGGDFQQQFPRQLTEPLLDWLQVSLFEEGGSISRFVGMPTDSDDTGMIVAALNLAGRPALAEYLLHFERENYFACFERERGASLSANAHVLAALLSQPEPARRKLTGSIKKVVDYLYSVRDAAGYWEDKWHLSPYYATACAGLALAAHDSEVVRMELLPTIEWLLKTQSGRDGGWGSGDFSTGEETAYALQLLQAVPDLIAARDWTRYSRAIQRGRDYLWQQINHYFAGNPVVLPKLWRGKELYVPARVVYSAVLGVLLADNVGD